MPYFHITHKRNLIQCLPPNNRAVPYNRMNYPTSSILKNKIPRFLPVLQPPTFPRLSDYYQDEPDYEEIEEELYPYPTVLIPDQRETRTKKFIMRPPKIVPHPYHTQQQLKRSSTRHFRPYTYY